MVREKMKKLVAIFFSIGLIGLPIMAVEPKKQDFNVRILHDKTSIKPEIQVYLFENFEDTAIFQKSLEKPKTERHKSILGLRYLDEFDVSKAKTIHKTITSDKPVIYFVVLYLTNGTYVTSTGELGPNDRLKVKVNRNGSLGYIRYFDGQEEKIGWQDSK